MTEMVSVEVLNRFDRYDYYHIITFFPRVEVVVVLLHSLNIYQDQERVLCLHTNPHTVTSSLYYHPQRRAATASEDVQVLRLEEDEGVGRAEYMKVSRVWLLFPRAVKCSHLLKAAPCFPCPHHRPQH